MTPSWVLNRALIPLVACFAIAVAACGGDTRSDVDETAAEAAPKPLDEMTADDLAGIDRSQVRTALSWTEGRIRNQGSEFDTVRTLRRASVSAHAAFDRVELEFDGAGTFVAYLVEAVDGPLSGCGGEVQVEPEETWLQFRVSRLRGDGFADDIVGSPAMAGIQEIRLVCEEEEALEWALRLSRPGRHRLIGVRNPHRLVLDVEH